MTIALLVVTLLKLGAVGTGPRMLVGIDHVFWSDDLDASVRGEWWSLCRTPKASTDQLLKVTATARRTKHQLDEKLGWRIRSEGCADSAILLRDFPSLDTTRELARASRKQRGPRTTLELGAQTSTLTDTRTFRDLHGVADPNSTRHRVVLRSGARSQVLLDEKAETDLDVLWAGDLDGDGKLDLLLRVPSHEAATDIRLYLSTAAKGDNLVGQVASQYTGSC